MPNIPCQARRFYMAGTARFLTRVREAEWIGGEQPYGYSQNNPISYSDPSGLEPFRHGGPRPHHKKPVPWDSSPCKEARKTILGILTSCFDADDAETLASVMQCIAFGESGCHPTAAAQAVNETAYGLYQLGETEIARCFPTGCSDRAYARTQRGDNSRAAVAQILWLTRAFGGSASIGATFCRYWGVLDCPGHHRREGSATSDCLKAKGINPSKIPMPKPKPGCNPCK